jgi:chitin synthase
MGSMFCIDFADKFVQSYVLCNTFEDSVGYNGHIDGSRASSFFGVLS